MPNLELSDEEAMLIQKHRGKKTAEEEARREYQQAMLAFEQQLLKEFSDLKVRWYVFNAQDDNHQIHFNFTFGEKFYGSVSKHEDKYLASARREGCWPHTSVTPSDTPSEAFRKAMKDAMSKEEWEGLRVLVNWVLKDET